jgi:hypothetical protein
MRSFVVAFALIDLLVLPASAADVSLTHRSAGMSSPVLLFPRTERAAAIWNERACWSQCGATCTWAMAACLNRDPQGVCLDVTNSCDRTCLRGCRTSGGPYLPDIFDF